MNSAASSTESPLISSTHIVDMSTSIDTDARYKEAIFLSNQEQSPLLRLPAELRNKIYEYALGGFKILTYGPRNPYWCSILSRSRAHRVSTSSANNETERFLVQIQLIEVRKSLEDAGRKNFQALTTTCRQIRSESALLPLLLNKLAAQDVGSLIKFAKALTPEQCGAIRTISLRLTDTAEVRRLAAWDSAFRDTDLYDTVAATLQDVPNITNLTKQMLLRLPGLKSVHFAYLGYDHCLEKIDQATTSAASNIKYTFTHPRPKPLSGYSSALTGFFLEEPDSSTRSRRILENWHMNRPSRFVELPNWHNTRTARHYQKSTKTDNLRKLTKKDLQWP